MQGNGCTITQSKARDNPCIIIGSLMICNFSTSMLFDTGATNSFISLSHAETINHQVEPLQNGIHINTPSSKVILVELVCKDCKIKFRDIVLG